MPKENISLIVPKYKITIYDGIYNTDGAGDAGGPAANIRVNFTKPWIIMMAFQIQIETGVSALPSPVAMGSTTWYRRNGADDYTVFPIAMLAGNAFTASNALAMSNMNGITGMQDLTMPPGQYSMVVDPEPVGFASTYYLIVLEEL